MNATQAWLNLAAPLVTRFDDNPRRRESLRSPFGGDEVPEHVAADMLAWSVDAGDLDTLATMTALAQPQVLGVDLARHLLDHVEALLDAWTPDDEDRFLARANGTPLESTAG